MTRVKRGVTSHARHKKVLKQVKGQYFNQAPETRAVKGLKRIMSDFIS